MADVSSPTSSENLSISNLQRRYAHVPWVFGDDSPVLREVIALGTPFSLGRGELIRETGKNYSDFFIVTSGLLLASSLSVHGHLIPRWVACPGSFIGENTLFTQHPAFFQIMAVEPCTLVRFDLQQLATEILPKFPEFSIALMESMAFKRYTNTTSGEEYSTKERVALFISLCQSPALAGRTAFIKLSPHNIAALLNIHKGTCTKIINEFIKNDLVEITPSGCISAPDISKLHQILQNIAD